jgi:glutathione S-transferase
MSESKIILHQYDLSPFSGKVRAVLGIKGVQWFACDQPTILPKDDLVTLTGGYRRVPVLQIGADLYLDSGLIIDELERRFPSPSVFGGSGPGIGRGLAHWADAMLMTIVPLLYGGDRDSTAEYRADRSALLGIDFNVEAMARTWSANAEKLRFHLALLESQLADGRAFLMSNVPDITDASFYNLIEYMHRGMGRTAALLEAFPSLLRWAERVRSIGQGEPSVMSREEAIRIAEAAKPLVVAEPGSRLSHEPEPGDQVEFKYADCNTPSLLGVLEHISPYRVAVRRKDPEVGEIMLHIPRSLGQVQRRTP